LKRAPKKEGWLQKKMKEAQQMAEAGKAGSSSNKPYQPGGFNKNLNNKGSKPNSKKNGK
jgi:hypothetical protein